MRLRIYAITTAFILFASLPVTASRGDRAILSIAHVSRHGTEIAETYISVMRDHKYFVQVLKQERLSPRPDCNQSVGVLPADSFRRVASLMNSPQVHGLRNSATRIRQGEGAFWYISIPRQSGTQFLEFSGQDSNKPDIVARLIAWFEETEKLNRDHIISVKDNRCAVFSDETADAWRR